MTSRINSRLRNTARISVTVVASGEPPAETPSLDFSQTGNSQYIGQVM
ncbi:hypothetical protein PP744_gp035 [Rhizobium phage RHph_N38]|uniref:Uncharacterized protein n=1 Tax=Rhizobium phage RHph_N38 TaxID=2509750 RepID=A0A7S5R3E8_9CAUD|nr:hypothetical protein PP744_gp035 [Rhizobium phage RHph_N38]QIG70498.1 hypothetical protein EVB89_035 [Rhizobium phage RHph_N38]